MNIITATRLWQSTLGGRATDDSQAEAREKLRVSFVSFRERAGLLAAEIHRDLPEFTVHDVTHLDALWEIADIVGGPELSLSPPEAFVLGGTFLLHDLGKSLASYPQGIQELKSRETWNDTIALQFIEKYNRQPTADELAEPPHRGLKKLPTNVQKLLFLLVEDLKADGPIQKSWNNFSPWEMTNTTAI